MGPGRRQGEQVRGPGVTVGLVERGQVPFAGVRRRRGQVQLQVRHLLAPGGGGGRLALDLGPGVGEIEGDSLDESGHLGRERHTARRLTFSQEH